jgi:hypothetical protein
MWIFYVLGGLCAFAILVPPIFDWIDDRFISRDGGYGRMLANFHDDARARGLSYHQANDELTCREALAKIRRLASEAVLADPSNWYIGMTACKERVVEDLARARPDLALAVSETLKTLNHSHILYPAEAKMVDRLPMRLSRPPRPSDDQIAALRIVR